MPLATAGNSAPVRPIQAASMMASLEAALADLDTPRTPRATARKPVTRAEAAAAQADLDTRARAGKTVMLRNARGQFIGSTKVFSFGGRKAETTAATPADLLARIFPRWKGDASEPAVASAPKRGPAPTAACAMEMA